MTKVTSLFLLALAGFTFFGCLRSPETGELVKHMLVQTEYNTDFINQTDTVFTTYSTFVIREDTMGFVSNLSTAKYILESDVPDFVVPVISSIEDEFLGKGYTKVTVNDNPDFSVNVVVLQNFSYYQSVNYGGYGYGYPGSYYYGYYNYYYPVVSTYSANYVTLLIQVVDAKNLVNNKYPIIWSAYIGDLNATIDLKGKTLEAVSTAFEQSPYIRKN